MDFETAVAGLCYHCSPASESDSSRPTGSFLESLRPYRGELDRAAWEDLLRCVTAVEEHLKTATKLDRRVIGSLWNICFCARQWAFEPDGMLRRNHLISENDQAILSEWIEDLSLRVMLLLDLDEASEN